MFETNSLDYGLELKSTLLMHYPDTLHPDTYPCRRKAREAKQYSKQVQAEKQKERAAAKKKQIESVTNMRKQREKSVSI